MREHDAWDDAADRGRRIGHRVEAHERIGSTSDRARELLATEAGEGIAVVAEEQLAGRGRRGRTWSSPPGVNLMVSVGFRPRLAAADAWKLGLAVALAAREACAAYAPVDLKWPNDLVDRDGRKVGGLLVETAIDAERVASAIVGVGINVNWPRAAMPDEIRATATALREIAAEPIDRVALLGRLLQALDAEVAAVQDGASPLDRYRSACATLGTEVEVTSAGTRVRGRAVDLDTGGGLVVDTADGRVSVTSGEVESVRPTVSA